MRFVCFKLIFVGLSLAACGGSGSDISPPPVATTPPSSQPPPDPWLEVKDAVEASPISDLRLIIGDADGTIFDYEKGSFALETEHRIASASKLLTGLTLMRLVESGALSLSDNPQDYIPDWVSDPQDERSQVTLEQALSFTTGFNASPLTAGCILRGLTPLENCVIEIHDDGLETVPGDVFYYGPEHMHIAAGMAQRATDQDYVNIFEDQIAGYLSLSNTRFATPSEINPRASGGAVSSAQDYAEILRALMAGELIADMDSFTRDRTENVSFGFRPDSIGREAGDWHYGLGFWRECDDFVWQVSCSNDIVISSPGAFGWLPWVDFSNNYFGLIATEDSEGGLIGVGSRPTSRSVTLEQELQPLIEAALAEVR